MCLKGQDPEMVRLLGPDWVRIEKSSLEHLCVHPDPKLSWFRPQSDSRV
jgi:hypothetical protein